MHSLHADFNSTRINDMRTDAAARRLGLRMHRNGSHGGLRRRFGALAADAGSETGPALAIRRLDPGGHDRAALARVAGRDSRDIPTGDVLGAELDGRLIAALSLSTGESVADPFEPTAAARNMLRARAEQMQAGAIVTPRVIDALPARS